MAKLFMFVKDVFAVQFGIVWAGRLQSHLSFLRSSSHFLVAVATVKPGAAPAFRPFCSLKEKNSVISGAGHSFALMNLFNQHPANACCLGDVCSTLVFDEGITQ